MSMGAIDDVGEAPFQAAEGFLAGGAGLLSPLEAGTSLGVRSGLRQGDAVDRDVQLTVPRPDRTVPF
jgi:hypothetical protein